MEAQAVELLPEFGRRLSKIFKKHGSSDEFVAGFA
jgi:hypothetical protein